jgi:outer membrane cobalamin receptor
MKRNVKRCSLVALSLMLVVMAAAQTTVSGVLIDAQTHETLIGATVSSGPHAATTSDVEGNFTLSVPAGSQEIKITYLGYETKSIAVNATGRTVQLGTIEMSPNVISLSEVMVSASVGIARKTPVAISTIPASVIQEVLGTQEFPEILNTTPGIYATKDGGSFGDSRINVRGFESANTAMMVNGIPVNDMEWGGVYWSNWAGLADVTRSMQVQRGLGAAKVSAPSVGGSINIVTKTTDTQKEGTIYYGIGNDGYNKITFNVSTGLMDNGWAITLLGAKQWGNGYILGTEFEGYSYFINISKRINNKHELSLTAFGAPQEHYQRSKYDRLFIGDWEKFKEQYRFNPTYGFDQNGQRKTAYFNYYHKPQISLNHLWTINDKSNLSTALYVSIGRGGGYNGRGRNANVLYGANNGVMTTAYRTVDNYFDYAKVQEENAADPNGSLVAIVSSTNDHNWYGVLSTYNTKIGDHLDVYGGLDVRYYEGIHQGEVIDLLGGKFFIDPQRAQATNRPEGSDPAWVNKKLKEGDLAYRDYLGYVTQGGFFGQAEYSVGGLSAFVSASISDTWYWRTDRFYYDNETSDVVDHLGWSAKGGANYNINEYHNVFFNAGGFSRAPSFSGGIFLSSLNSNAINRDAKNEKILSAEIGYGFRTNIFAAKLNAYYTNWYDKTTVRAIESGNPDAGTINLTGVNASHMGVELEARFQPVRDFELNAMLSIGDWRWTNNPEGYMFDRDGMPVDAKKNIVPAGSADHARMKLNMEDVHVGNAAQTTAAVGATYNFLKSFRAGFTWRYFGRNYSYYSIPTGLGDQNIAEPWIIPAGNVSNLYLSYRFKVGALDATLQGNIDNLFDQMYIADANDGSSHDWDTAAVMYGFGRTWSIGLKVRF